MTGTMADQRGFRISLKVLLPWVLVLSGCATIAPVPGDDERFLEGHYVLAHEDGFALGTDRQRLRHRKLSAAAAREDIRNRIVEGIDAHALRLWPTLGKGETAQGQPLQLMLYAHGGLNGYGDDFTRMRTLLAVSTDCDAGGTPSRLFVSAACPRARSHYYPVFVNWNSEAWDSVRDDLFFIRFGRRVEGWEYMLAIGAPFVAAGRLAEAIFNSINGFASNVQTFVHSDPDASDYLEGVVTILPRLLITPVVKAFGTSAWQIMNRRAGLLTAQTLPSQREGVLWSLLSELDQRIEVDSNGAWWRMPSRGAKVPIEITLVGHSMGAIVLNRVLVASRELNTLLPIKRVVYLAAAASIKDSEAVKLLRRWNQDVRFWSFMLYHRDEARERSAWGLAPRGTLLVWIDDFFEPVVEAADKRNGAAQSYREFRGSRLQDQGICEWERKGVRPQTHGAFNEGRFLEAALRHVAPQLFVASATGPEAVAQCRQ